MKWGIGGVALMAVASVVALIVAISGTRDPVPGQLRTCAQDARLAIVLGQGDLDGQPRSDIRADAVREVQRTKVGDDTAVILQGTAFRLLVVGTDDSPSLDGDLARRVYENPSAYALVARGGADNSGALGECVEVAVARSR